MASSSCYICGEPLENREVVNVGRGLETLINASERRQDGKDSFFRNAEKVILHVDCRKWYAKKKY